MATSPVTFLQETKDELKKVTWPTQNEIIRLTIVVVLVSLLVGIFIGSLDFTFTKTIETLVK